MEVLHLLKWEYILKLIPASFARGWLFLQLLLLLSSMLRPAFEAAAKHLANFAKALPNLR